METTSPSLLERLAGGADASAWGRFVELYTPLLMRWCRRLGLSDADAADYAQDVFVVALQHLPQFRYDPAQSFRAWLKTVLTNSWRKHRRKAARGPAVGGDADQIADDGPSHFVDEAEHRDYLVRRALEIAQSDLDPTAWKACWEFVVNDRPAADVAAELGVTVNVVYLAKSRVLKRLRDELAGLAD